MEEGRDYDVLRSHLFPGSLGRLEGRSRRLDRNQVMQLREEAKMWIVSWLFAGANFLFFLWLLGSIHF